ncbi:hypothetical protein G7072_18925 [Nocardioides sp. HDW12B]|uniref:hypothetical protein n=1 Tax=Nocardioides sp. HDW12B TaxID=2714939 RepID=UPI0014093DCB|nr:hypothetical protein [Nocardioides sp. HDW12B]QIK68134.1 hypothetical protein G7072_18925 [Nocardioides sp. HDW12B]
MNKKLALGITAGIAAFGAVTASASSLGGVDTTDLGTSASVVASCDTDGVGVDYTTAYSAGSYRVTAVKLSGIAATCAGQDVTVTLFDGSDVSLAEKAGANSGATQTLTLTAPVSAEAVEGVAVVIAG